MQLIENQTLSGETISLDDKHFIKCLCKGCTLIYSGGDCTLTDTRVEDCKLVFSGPAEKTTNFLRSLGILRIPIGAAIPTKSPEKTIN